MYSLCTVSALNLIKYLRVVAGENCVRLDTGHCTPEPDVKSTIVAIWCVWGSVSVYQTGIETTIHMAISKSQWLSFDFSRFETSQRIFN